MATHRDPRSIVTPDAFEVSDELIGMPLAAPRRRAVALAIDGIVISMIAVVTSSFSLILGVVAAGFFMRAGFKRTPVRGSVFGRAMRFSVGCLGIFIAIITASIWSAVGFFSGGDDDADDGEPSAFETLVDVGRVGSQVLETLTEAGLVIRFDGIETLEDAEELAQGFIDGAEELGIDRDAQRDLLLAAEPQADWADEWEGLVYRLLPDASMEELAEARADAESAVDGYSDEEALAAFAELLDADPEDVEATALRSELLTRLLPLVAGDTVGALEERNTDLSSEVQALQTALDAASQGDDRGFVARILGFANELGFGFSWGILYVTVLLPWWKGRTVGKKMMGIRVVRLDGEPITWWVAFERVGGYAAGFATGLLGFAQVWWDANRQGIHDRIVGTVVIMDGAEKVSDWESAL